MALDNIQREIVTTDSKNVIIAAGAGSGKTYVLVERIKYLLEKGVRPDSIIAITFTNRAAEEMKARLMGVSGIGDAFIGTIHSFANKILRNSGMSYEILSQDKEIEIMRYLISKYAKYLTIDSYMLYLDIVKDVLLGIRDEKDIPDNIPPSHLHELHILKGNERESLDDYPETLHSICIARNILTFDKLLKVAKTYFQSINGKVEYLLVDELQDIGYLEYNFLKSLNADNNFYVGDDWQSIYAFKGGDVRIFLRLMEDPNWTTYYLTNNYRNSKNILAVADTVIHQVNDIINKPINGIRENKGSVKVDSRYKIDRYLDKIQEQGDYKDWFILVRTNKDIRQLSNLLDEKGIPHITFKQGNNTSESLDIKIAMDAVKLLTVHTSKGLESKNVILYGNFPVYTKSYLRDNDERKVMYVGITRAEDNLIILN